MNIKEIEGLTPDRAFNNSVCRFNGKMMMAYRGEDPRNGLKPAIYLCELDAKFNPHAIRSVPIPRPQEHSDLFEDPRLFVHDGHLWMSFISAMVRGQHYAAQGVLRFEENGSIDRIFYPRVGKNENEVSAGNGKMTREKNWVFFSHDGKIRVLYSINPLRVGEMDPDTGKIEFLPMRRFDCSWAWGNLSGSTGLVPINGELFGAFHSFTRSKQRDYHIGFYAVDPKYWCVTRISDSPWMSARLDNHKDKRPYSQTWRPNVVFPCGIFQTGTNLAISFGWQDCRSMLVIDGVDVLYNHSKPICRNEVQCEAIRDPYGYPPGGFKCQVGRHSLGASTWRNLLRQAKRFGILEEQVQESICTRLPNNLKTLVWRPMN